jgi:hypothetical protein
MRLEVVQSNVLLGAFFVLMAVGLLCQEVPKFFDGRANWRVPHDDVPAAVGILFLAVGLLVCRRIRAVFDRVSQQMSLTTWTLFGTNRRTLPFRSITGAVFQSNPNQFVNDHPQRGPDMRLVLSTEEGVLPLGWMYRTRSASDVKARDAINEFLGVRVEENLDDSVGVGADIRGLIAEGRTIEAIKRVRDRRLCSIAEAKRIVEGIAERP